MKFQLFRVSTTDPKPGIDELNQFLERNLVHKVDQRLVDDGQESFWSFCVRFASGGQVVSQASRGASNKIDYRHVLSSEDFAIYSRLRALRKGSAEKEGVPPYALFTNEQLAEMVKRRVSSAAAIAEIPGIGTSRVTKYAEAFVDELQKAIGADPGKSEPFA